MSIRASIKLVATGLIEVEKVNTDGELTLETIKQCVNNAIKMCNAVGQIDAEALIAEFERNYHTYVNEPLTLNDDQDGWEAWLPKAKAAISWGYWERYRTYLLQQKNLPKPVVDAIDAVTDETLGNLTNPKTQNAWDRRGMVVGDVQAGKTTNYSGLICKAVDAGYKVIIVLTGFHNNLRTQTQIRLEEAFIGYNTDALDESARVPIGVGVVSSDPSLRVNTITTRSDNGDFSRAVAKNFRIHPGGHPLIFVIKKNASVLRNVVKYLETVHHYESEEGGYHIKDTPLLLIDDEADQGSVDTKKMGVDLGGDLDPDHDPTTINKLIRKILLIFTQSAYVGYTATPFANIFIHNDAKTTEYGEDLFPRSFITVMPTPSNYVGPKKVFGLTDDDGENGTQGLPIIRPISDYADTTGINERSGWMPPKHKKYHIPTYHSQSDVPPSLEKAVMTFILGCAVRDLRGQGDKHTSMLIHVTRFVDVQERVFKQVEHLMIGIKQDLRYGEEGSKQRLYRKLQDLWETDFITTNKKINHDLCPLYAWENLKRAIVPSVESIQIRRINGSAGDVLDYELHKKSGLNVIAIGGDKLSRGLTLEGLTVSYFTRHTRMYDTLMQMGRWFGYRDGFIDLCRLFAPDSLIEWFEHITDASEQLRNEFNLMTQMGGTPANYGQRVRSHPLLLVTSRVKMRHSMEMSISYQGVISETIVFSRAREDVDLNFKAGQVLIKAIDSYAPRRQQPLYSEKTKKTGGKHLWVNVKVDDILAFLHSYKTPEHTRRVNTNLLAKYIETQVGNGDLGNWSVLLAGKNPNRKSPLKVDFGDHVTGLLTRANYPPLPKGSTETSKFYRIRRLVSPSDEAWDLSLNQYENAKNLMGDNKSNRLGGKEIRVSREKSQALLILYPLEKQSGTGPFEPTDSCYLGFAISFPGNKDAKPVTYRVNPVYQGQADD